MSKATSLSKSRMGGDPARRKGGEANGREAERRMAATAEPGRDSLSREEIERRAYALFLERGGTHGDDWSDWLRAETELRGERNSRKAA